MKGSGRAMKDSIRGQRDWAFRVLGFGVSKFELEGEETS